MYWAGCFIQNTFLLSFLDHLSSRFWLVGGNSKWHWTKLEVNRVLPSVHCLCNVHAWLVTLQNVLHVHRESAQLVDLVYYSSTMYNFFIPPDLDLLFKYSLVRAWSVICWNMVFINQPAHSCVLSGVHVWKYTKGIIDYMYMYLSCPIQPTLRAVSSFSS